MSGGRSLAGPNQQPGTELEKTQDVNASRSSSNANPTGNGSQEGADKTKHDMKLYNVFPEEVQQPWDRHRPVRAVTRGPSAARATSSGGTDTMRHNISVFTNLLKAGRASRPNTGRGNGDQEDRGKDIEVARNSELKVKGLATLATCVLQTPGFRQS